MDAVLTWSRSMLSLICQTSSMLPPGWCWRCSAQAEARLQSSASDTAATTAQPGQDWNPYSEANLAPCNIIGPSAVKSSIRRFVITEKAPTRAFS